MSLKKYRHKRNFNKTPEPAGREEKSRQRRYVIQRHDARQLHYDLRLEMEGVLKCWAIPKGPSLNPQEKRLAIPTEDHPVKYLHFQGIIPKGNYGAGEMTIWDKGTYTSYKNPDEPEKLNKEYNEGTLHLLFHGQKIQGKYTLVRTNYGKNDQWLLIKQVDPYSTDEGGDKIKVEDDVEINNEKHISLETIISPMLATSAREPFNDPDWLFELKYDGYRVLSNIRNHQVRLYSRYGIDYNQKFPEVHDELSLLSHEAILDGEMIVLDPNGLPQFQALQNYDNRTEGKLKYMVFDLLHLNGHSLLELPLSNRKELLRNLLPDGDSVQYCDHIAEEGRSFYREAVNQGLEGIVAKRKESYYRPGKRTGDWLKIKQIQTADPIICGYTESEKSGRPFGSLILGEEKEGALRYSGNCGSGFSHKKLNELFELFQPFKQNHSPFSRKIDLKGRIPHWLSPELVCEIKYNEVTSGGLFRQPVFLRMRMDKKRTVSKSTSERKEPTNIASEPIKNNLEINGVNLSFSHLDKIYWPETGLRKYDLLDYYIGISDVIMPYLVDRPQNLHRHPDGIAQPGFYQKDQEYLPEWVETTELHSKSADKKINYLLCQNEATLLYMVNLGCIEINPWLSRVSHIDHPDFAVIDLDPSPSNIFDQVIEAALVFKEVMDKIEIPGLVKTSGSKGIHICIPMAGEYSFDQVRDFIKLLCIMVQNKVPKLTTTERSLKKRGQKIYLDYLQNRRGQTIAAPYSVRPVPGAWVSAPVTWQELEDGIHLHDFNLHSMPTRIKKKGDLFSSLFKTNINMTKALNKLEIPH